MGWNNAEPVRPRGARPALPGGAAALAPRRDSLTPWTELALLAQEARRSRSANPLQELLRLLQERRDARRRTPYMRWLWLPCLLSVAVMLYPAAVSWLEFELDNAGPGLAPDRFLAFRLELLEAFQAGLRCCLLPLLAWAAGWLVLRYHATCQLAQASLGRAPRQQGLFSVDDNLATTVLRPHEYLAAFVGHALDRLALPLAAVHGMLGLVGCCAEAAAGYGYPAAAEVLASLGRDTPLAALLTVCSLLAALTLLLLSLAFSAALRQTLPQAIGVLLAVGGAPLVLGLGYLTLGPMGYLPSWAVAQWTPGLGYAVAGSAALALLLAGCLWLARRSAPVAAVLAAGWPLLVSLAYGVLACGAYVALFPQNYYYYYYFDSSAETAPFALTVPLELLCLLRPSQLGILGGACLGWIADPAAALLSNLPRWLALLPCQLGLLALAAGYALDAVRRRQAGTD